jgi:hypothetical protein
LAKIILDESVLREGQLENLSAAPDRWIVNCRVSKMGGCSDAYKCCDPRMHEV